MFILESVFELGSNFRISTIGLNFHALMTAIVFFEFLFLGEWKETWGEGWLGRLRGNYKSAWAPMHVTCPRGVTPKSVRPTPVKRPRTAPRSRQRQYFAERWVFEFLIKALISFWKMHIIGCKRRLYMTLW